VVVMDGLVDTWPASMMVATHAQRLREDQADRAPRARVARRTRGRHHRADRQAAG